MWILEIYQSKQGEGLWTGKYSIFVRTLGCALRCRYCDSPYAQQNRTENENDNEGIGANLSAEEIVGRILLLELPHVVITGGEPMQAPEIVELTRLLKDFDYQITIETAGIFDAPVLCDLMSISPKLSNSTPLKTTKSKSQSTSTSLNHEQNRFKPEVIQNLMFRYNYQLKFVVDTPNDLDEIEKYLNLFQGVVPERVFLMPQAVDVNTMTEKALWIVPFCERHGYQYCPRMQIIWYGNKRRT
ncbi:MAG: 7-carboxy-7-deazaguanine synthase QueE [Planctomycetaceae bacterium]|jgi:7-carboxy-7-deazaguanine synthase|nr:7-carboxy-7-deazaguanine synthase QueE [Planctomycetaceae bacterium]